MFAALLVVWTQLGILLDLTEKTGQWHRAREVVGSIPPRVSLKFYLFYIFKLQKISELALIDLIEQIILIYFTYDA